jgi:hypothetical protein
VPRLLIIYSGLPEILGWGVPEGPEEEGLLVMMGNEGAWRSNRSMNGKRHSRLKDNREAEQSKQDLPFLNQFHDGRTNASKEESRIAR